MSELESHELADVLRLMNGSEYKELLASIKTNGLIDAITLYEGKILDGRNRYRACLEAGVEPRTENYSGIDPASFVADRNLRRRHLTAGQKAMAVKKLARLSNGQRRDYAATGKPVAVKTLPELAAMVGINKETISSANTICTFGTHEEVTAVEHGAPITRVAKQVRARRDSSGGKPKQETGSRIKSPPDGETLTAFVKGGVLKQKNGMKVDDVLKLLKMSATTYKTLRDTILLSERDDLSKSEMAAVARALVYINNERRVDLPRELIAPIVARIWGAKGNRFIRRPDKRNATRFMNTVVGLVLTTCESAAQVTVPVLSKEQCQTSIKKITEAQQLLDQLIDHIMEIYNG